MTGASDLVCLLGWQENSYLAVLSHPQIEKLKLWTLALANHTGSALLEYDLPVLLDE